MRRYIFAALILVLAVLFSYRSIAKRIVGPLQELSDVLPASLYDKRTSKL